MSTTAPYRYSFTSNFHHTSPRVGIISVFYLIELRRTGTEDASNLMSKGNGSLQRCPRSGLLNYQTPLLPVMRRGANPQ